jgi:hypothetical protein
MSGNPLAHRIPNPDFPVRVRIFGVPWNYDRGEISGYGRANIVGPPLQGLYFNFLCDES